jgi:hypothetical protein
MSMLLIQNSPPGKFFSLRQRHVEHLGVLEKPLRDLRAYAHQARSGRDGEGFSFPDLEDDFSICRGQLPLLAVLRSLFLLVQEQLGGHEDRFEESFTHRHFASPFFPEEGEPELEGLVDLSRHQEGIGELDWLPVEAIAAARVLVGSDLRRAALDLLDTVLLTELGPCGIGLGRGDGGRRPHRGPGCFASGEHSIQLGQGEEPLADPCQVTGPMDPDVRAVTDVIREGSRPAGLVDPARLEFREVEGQLAVSGPREPVGFLDLLLHRAGGKAAHQTADDGTRIQLLQRIRTGRTGTRLRHDSLHVSLLLLYPK